MPQPDMTEIDAYHERIYRPLIQVPRSPLGRFFFGLALVLWFGILLLPCAMFSLAVMSVEQRGLQIVQSVVMPLQDEQQCVETHVSYFLWYTDGTDESAVFCDCYRRDGASARWQSSGSTLGACQG
jgi:hypothetical protein